MTVLMAVSAQDSLFLIANAGNSDGSSRSARFHSGWPLN